MKVAVIYDRVNKWGGAERVLLALNKIFPQAPLYTSVYLPQKAKWAEAFPEVKTSFLQKVPFTRGKHEYLAPLMPLAFEQFDFSEFDIVISVTSEAAKGIITLPKTKHLCICLTPTRYLWSGHKLYFQNSILRFLSWPIVAHLRRWDKVAAQRPDEIVAISTAVQKRIKKYYGRDAKIIHPPAPNLLVKDSKFSDSSLFGGTQGYYLVVSRLVPYKKVDLVIETFNSLGYPLVIIGTGSEEKRLKRMAGDNIEFVERLTDGKLADYYNNCKALVLAQEEDFGLVAVEAQKFGKPVVAYRAGGALDIIQEARTGVFFNNQTKEALKKAVLKSAKIEFNSQVIKKNAQKFSQEKFTEELKKLLSGFK